MTMARLLPVFVFCAAALGGACAPEIPTGQYSCVPGEEEACPGGWVCRADPEDGHFRCFSTAGDPFCGDGNVDPGEECDGRNLNGLSCVDLDYPSGLLHCAADCTLNETGCISNLCGNGALEPNEECDGSAGGAETCSDFGGASGSLRCDLACRWDPSDCAALASCGNAVLDGAEACDGTNLGAATCASLGFAGGTLACRANCTLDTVACEVNTCGDGVAQAFSLGYEECDGSDLRGLSCEDFGMGGDELACTPDCRFDLSACTAATTCGNGLRQGFEQCDALDLDNQTCSSLGYGGGTLTCHPNCTWDLSGCQ